MLFVVITKRETLVLISWWILKCLSHLFALHPLLHSLLALACQFIVDQSVGKLGLTFSTVSMPVWWTLQFMGTASEVALHEEKLFSNKNMSENQNHILKSKITGSHLCMMSRWLQQEVKWKLKSRGTDFPCDSSLLGFWPLKGRGCLLDAKSICDLRQII